MTEFSIYQINMDRDSANVCFIGMESLEKIKGTKDVNAAAYDRVYDGKMDCISLENIYQKFNVDHPADYTGRSLSVSDVVEIRESDTLNPGFYFVDSIGFKSISFDKSLCKEPVEADASARKQDFCPARGAGQVSENDRDRRHAGGDAGGGRRQHRGIYAL